jgi:hypothetical protein
MHSESDTSPDDDTPLKLVERQKPRRNALDQPVQLPTKPIVESTLKEDLTNPGVYSGYVSNPPQEESGA